MGSYKVAALEEARVVAEVDQSNELVQTAQWGRREMALLSPLSVGAIGTLAGMALGPLGMIIGGLIGFTIGAIVTHIVLNRPIPLQMTPDTCNGDKNTFGGKLYDINEYKETDPDQRIYSHLPISRDFVFSDPENGIIALTDHTGHAGHNINDNLKRELLWKQVCNAIRRVQKEFKLLTPEALRKIMQEANLIYETHLVGGTFLIASAKKEGSRQYVDFAVIGDARLYHVSSDGRIRQLASNSSHERAELPGRPGQAYIDRVEVKPGDIVFAVSDGVYDCLSPENMATIARRSDGETLFPNLIGAICNPHSEGITLAKKPDDDISAVGLYF